MILNFLLLKRYQPYHRLPLNPQRLPYHSGRTSSLRYSGQIRHRNAHSSIRFRMEDIDLFLNGVFVAL